MWRGSREFHFMNAGGAREIGAGQENTADLVAAGEIHWEMLKSEARLKTQRVS